VEPKEHKLWARRIDDALARLKRLPPGMTDAESRDAANGPGGRRETSARPTICSATR